MIFVVVVSGLIVFCMFKWLFKVETSFSILFGLLGSVIVSTIFAFLS